MRRFTFWLMMLILPLRALAGDAMALRAVMSASAGQTEAAMPADCPMMSAAGRGAGSDEAPASCCDTCDLCLPLAEMAATTGLASATARHVMRANPAAAALALAPAPSVKPPIS